MAPVGDSGPGLRRAQARGLRTLIAIFRGDGCEPHSGPRPGRLCDRGLVEGGQGLVDGRDDGPVATRP